MNIKPFIALLTPIALFALTGEEILEKMDINRDYSTALSQAVMTIRIGDEVRTKSMSIKSIFEGSKSIVEFTNAEDLGTKYLMLDEDLWIYFPDEQDVVKISGHMLKEGMMGSDVSYEDALESDRLSRKYKITLAGEEKIRDRLCYIIDLEAKVKDAPYYRRRMWVDKEDFVAWKEEMYAKSGKLLKEANVLEVRKIGGRTVPVRTEMINTLRRNGRTEFFLKDIQLDVPMDENEFTMRYLRR